MLNLDWKQLLANCFPKIMVNILPHFALLASDSQVAVRRETANRVYDLLKDANCLGKQVREVGRSALGQSWDCPRLFPLFTSKILKFFDLSK